jgi:hypothetical protein
VISSAINNLGPETLGASSSWGLFLALGYVLFVVVRLWRTRGRPCYAGQARRLFPFFGASGAAAVASSAYLAGGLAPLLLYRKQVPFRLRALVVPQSGDFEVLRVFAPAPLVRPRPQRS